MRRNADDLRLSVNVLADRGAVAARAFLAHLRSRLPDGVDLRVLAPAGSELDAPAAHGFPEAELVAVPAGRPAAAHNRGLRRAFGRGDDAVLLLSVEARPLAGFLDPMIELLKLRPRAAFVSPKVPLGREPGRLWYAGGAIDWWRGLALRQGAGQLDDGRFDRPGPTEFATGFCMLVRRQAFDRAGPLDESSPGALPDVDWSLRARRVGMEVHYQPRARVLHDGPEAGETSPARRLDDRLRLIARHGRWYHWSTVGPLLAASATSDALRGWRRLPGEPAPAGQSLPLQPRRRAWSRPRRSASR